MIDAAATLLMCKETDKRSADLGDAACPFCNTMLTDGVKSKEKEGSVRVYDLAELLAGAADL